MRYLVTALRLINHCLTPPRPYPVGASALAPSPYALSGQSALPLQTSTLGASGTHCGASETTFSMSWRAPPSSSQSNASAPTIRPGSETTLMRIRSACGTSNRQVASATRSACKRPARSASGRMMSSRQPRPHKSSDHDACQLDAPAGGHVATNCSLEASRPPFHLRPGTLEQPRRGPASEQA